MIELRHVLAPVDGTPFDEICSFETANYIGIYTDFFPVGSISGFVVMPRNDIEFSIIFIQAPNNLEELDSTVYDEVDEHIESVSTSRCLNIRIVEE